MASTGAGRGAGGGTEAPVRQEDHLAVEVQERFREFLET